MLKLLAIGLAAGFFGAIFGVGGGIVIVPLLASAARVRPAQRGRDVARCDPRLVGRGRGHIRLPRRGQGRCRRARRHSGDVRRDRGHDAAAAHSGAAALVRLRAAPGGRRREAARMTIALVRRDRRGRRCPRRALRCRRRDHLRPDARARARADPAARGGVVAARDPADGDRGHVATEALRERRRPAPPR